MEKALTLKLRALPDKGWASVVVDAITQQPIDEVVARNGYFCMALSGGSTPEPVYAGLAKRLLPWRSIFLVQVDERVVAVGDPRSNAAMIARALASALAAGADPFWMHTSFAEPEPAASYQLRTRGLELDTLVLGLGDDGHTASLFPGDGLTARPEDVLMVPAVNEREARMTLGRARLVRTGPVHLIARGANKARALQRLLAPTGSLEETPARILHEMRDVTVYADRTLLDAAGILA